jgi:hypothetical protein
MNRSIETNMEIRKEWSAPELKKVEIGQITAGKGGTGGDGGAGNRSLS